MRDALQKQGITNPTPEQLRNSLIGVLGQRADGKGWGQIANSMGFRLGELKRDAHATARMEPVRFDRPDKPQRPDKPERPDKPDRLHR